MLFQFQRLATQRRALSYRCFYQLSYNFRGMLAEHCGEKEFKINEVLSQLNLLMKEISEKPSSLEANLRAFNQQSIGRCLHVQFCVPSALCQHEVISKLFSPEALKIGTLDILQLFNLLLANTIQVNSLVYILAQPSLHDFLFHKFQFSKQSSDSIEYYIQLLKTIIMKMNNNNSSFIKMFCNNRYPSFPLLSQVCFLATQSKEELVRVTAQQCVLLLIRLLNEKRVGCGYLSQMQMSVFFNQITVQLSSNKSDLQGALKYLVDLISALQGNPLSLSMLLNTFSLNLLITLLGNLPLLLKIISTFSKIIKEHEDIQTTIYTEIKFIFGRIINKYCFNKFINGTYLSALRYKRNWNAGETVGHLQLMKYFSARFQGLKDNLKQIQEYQETKINSSAILTDWAEFNSSKEIRDLKGSEVRKSIFRFLMPKPDPVEIYIKASVLSNGMTFEHCHKTFLFKLKNSINFGTSLFFIQRILLKEQQKNDQPFQQYEVHFNDNRGNFDLSQGFCHEVLEMMRKIEEKNIKINKEYTRKELEDLQFEYIFLRRLKLYLINNLTDFILQIQKEYSVPELCQIRKLLRKLSISRHLQKNTLQKLLWKMQQLQLQINELTFMREFKLLIRYVLHSYSDKLHDISGQLPEYLDDLICSSMMKYEFISELIDPSVVNLQNYIEKQWKEFLSDEDHLKKFSFNKYGKKCEIQIRPKALMRFQVGVRNVSETDPVIFDILEPKDLEKIFQNEKMKEWGSEKENTDGDNRQSLLSLVLTLCSQREELITKWIVQYFQMTSNHLCSVLKQKNQKSMILHNS